MRVAELSSDDFHLDRYLYFSCRDDRERFCENVRVLLGNIAGPRVAALLTGRFSPDVYVTTAVYFFCHVLSLFFVFVISTY